MIFYLNQIDAVLDDLHSVDPHGGIQEAGVDMPVVLAIDAAAEGGVGADADVAAAVDVFVLEGVAPGLGLGVHAQADLADQEGFPTILTAGDDSLYYDFFQFAISL